jgi:hypothetical protein
MMFLLLALSLSGKCNPAPVTAAPVTAAPVTAAPVTAAPVTAAPVTAAHGVTRKDVRALGAVAARSRDAGERDAPAYRKRMKEDS